MFESSTARYAYHTHHCGSIYRCLHLQCATYMKLQVRVHLLCFTLYHVNLSINTSYFMLYALDIYTCLYRIWSAVNINTLKVNLKFSKRPFSMLWASQTKLHSTPLCLGVDKKSQRQISQNLYLNQHTVRDAAVSMRCGNTIINTHQSQSNL